MEFQFKAELAQQYGVEGAVFLHGMAFWVEKNRRSGRHFHQGRYWSYDTRRALEQRFPFWTRRQLDRIIANLKDAGALLSGNFSRDKTDRTCWYALSDRVLEVYQARGGPGARNGEMHRPKPGQPVHETGKCKKETVTDQENSTPLPPRGRRRGRKEPNGAAEALLSAYAAGDEELRQALDGLMEIRAAKRAVNSPRAVSALLCELDRLAGGSREEKLRIVEQSLANSWKSVFPRKGGGYDRQREERERDVE